MANAKIDTSDGFKKAVSDSDIEARIGEHCAKHGIDPLTAYLATSPGGMDSIPIIAASSNVDLSEEFINMIISSTGFSASSRVITTSDQLITELLNSTR